MTGHLDALARRSGHANMKRDVTPDASCKTGGFYKSPSNGATVNSNEPLAIKWDNTCLNATGVDIYLMAPGALKPLMQGYSNVNFANGQYNVTLNPQWWNNSATAILQLTIVNTGQSSALTPYPAGPVFTVKTVNSTASSAGSSGSGSTGGASTVGAVTKVNNFVTSGKLPAGSTAAAVIFPLLIVAGLCIAAYIKISRTRGFEKRKQFKEGVDKRMSTISTDWKSTTAAGAAAAIRHSMAIPGNRNSSFSFGAIRPTSSVDNLPETFDYTHTPAMSQRRPGVTAASMAERNSRGISKVSFAEGTRPSRETTRSRAFHSAYIPPVPSLPKTESETPSGRVSPTQAEGPTSLTHEDIEARLSGNDYQEGEDILPALNMIRTGGGLYSPEDSEFLFELPETPKATTTTLNFPQPPSPTHQSQIQRKQSQDSPVGMMPMQPMPANVMSPDDMLRAYAERRATQTVAPPMGHSPDDMLRAYAERRATGQAGITYPVPTANTTMRTLYSPTSMEANTQSFAMPTGQEARRQSTASGYSGEFHFHAE